MVKVAVLLPLRTLGELQGAALGLVTGGVGVRRIVGKIEPFKSGVLGAASSAKRSHVFFFCERV